MVDVYGIVAATEDRPPAVEGITAAPVRLVVKGDLGAPVSDLDTGRCPPPKTVCADLARA